MRHVQQPQLPDITSLPSAFSKRVLKDGVVEITITSPAAFLEARAFCRYVNVFLTNAGFEYAERACVVPKDVEVSSEVPSSVATSNAAGFFSGYSSHSLCSSVGSSHTRITEVDDKVIVRLSAHIVNHLVRSFPSTEKELSAWFRCAKDMRGNSSAPFMRDLAHKLRSVSSADRTPPVHSQTVTTTQSVVSTPRHSTLKEKSTNSSVPPSPEMTARQPVPAWPTLPDLNTDYSSRTESTLSERRSPSTISNALDESTNVSHETNTGNYQGLTYEAYVGHGGSRFRGLTIFTPFATSEKIRGRLEERARTHYGASSKLLTACGFNSLVGKDLKTISSEPALSSGQPIKMAT